MFLQSIKDWFSHFIIMLLSNIFNLSSDEIFVIESHHFKALNKTLKFINKQSKAEQYQWQRELNDYLVQASQVMNNVIEIFYKYMCVNESWKIIISKTVFKEKFSKLLNVVVKVTKEQNRQEETHRKILHQWDKDAQELLIHIMSYNLLTAVKRCAVKCILKNALLRVNQQILYQTLHLKSDVFTISELLTDDFNYILTEKIKLKSVRQSDLRKTELCMGHDELLQCDEVDQTMQNVIVMLLFYEEHENAEIKELSNKSDLKSKEVLTTLLTLFMKDDHSHSVQRDDLLQNVFNDSDETSVNVDEDFINRDLKSVDDLLDHDHNNEEKCSCFTEIAAHWQTKIQWCFTHQILKAIHLLKNMFLYENVCNKHQMNIIFHLDLKIQQIDLNVLLEKLEQLWLNWQQIEKFKIRKKTQTWFHQRHQFSEATANLKPYKFRCLALTPFFFEWSVLFQKLNIWSTQNTINELIYYSFISIWWDKKTTSVVKLSYTITQIMNYEFDMYQHHSQVLNKEKNLDWIWIILHFLSQQLI